MEITPVYRRLVLSLAGSRWASQAAQRLGMELGASRFVAGESLDEALAVAADLNRRGVLATLDHLGEGVQEERLARHMGLAYLDLLEGISQCGVQANVSLKLTQMGLALSPRLAADIVRGIVERAAALGNFVRIDMEDSPWTEATLALYRDLRSAGLENVGVVIQACLYRSARDVADLAAMGANVRVVKGAYREPPTVAYPRKADVDENYRNLAAALLTAGCYTAVATHDPRLIDWAKAFTAEQGITRDRFEFQMLYGVRMQWQEELAREGFRMRCYVPYGKMWYPYFVRRIAESPSNAGFLLRNLFKR